MNPFCSQSMIIRCRKDPGHRKIGRLPLALISLCALFFVASPLCIPAGRADEGLLRGPRGMARAGVEAGEPAAAHRGIMAKLAEAPVIFYQRFLGPFWGRRCSYYPSCSNYARLAIDKHGAFLGSIMAFDRLQHEADEGRHAPPIVVGGEMKVYDPLENNDYWWYRPARPEPGAPAGADRETAPDHRKATP
ncbi:MAG: hypothetical protein H6Q84_3216 [Deltaproteobacteria bacterium]|nr:hypothetical protein [Deltaproteobacteria bacterium]